MMNKEQVIEKIASSLSGSNVEELSDQPDDGVLVLRIETPFFNFQIEQQIALFAYFKEEENLLQFSDRGLYSYCVQDRDSLNIKRHRNFIKAHGYLMLGSENEEGGFVVNSPTVSLDSEDLDLSLLLGHYISLLLYAGEV
jgi:hypothetical protein